MKRNKNLLPQFLFDLEPPSILWFVPASTDVIAPIAIMPLKFPQVQQGLGFPGIWSQKFV